MSIRQAAETGFARCCHSLFIIKLFIIRLSFFGLMAERLAVKCFYVLSMSNRLKGVNPSIGTAKLADCTGLPAIISNHPLSVILKAGKGFYVSVAFVTDSRKKTL